MKMSDFVTLLASDRVPFKMQYQMSNSQGEVLPVLTVGPLTPDTGFGGHLVVDTYSRDGVFYILRVADMETPGLDTDERKISFNDLQNRITRYRQTHATDEAFRHFDFFKSAVDYANQ